MHYYLIVNKKTGKPDKMMGFWKFKKSAVDTLKYYKGFNANNYEVRKFKIEEVK